MTLLTPDALAHVATILSAVDQARRLLGCGSAPLAEVYLEAARGNLHHAREAILRYDSLAEKTARRTIGTDGRLEIVAGQPLCRWRRPDGWVDERRPAKPDLGADLMASDDARLASSTWHAGGMLLAAIADHAWLHLGSGTSWASDRSGANALVGAMNGGRPVAQYDLRMLAGALDSETVRLLASLGWRRLRSPKWSSG